MNDLADLDKVEVSRYFLQKIYDDLQEHMREYQHVTPVDLMFCLRVLLGISEKSLVEQIAEAKRNRKDITFE